MPTETDRPVSVRIEAIRTHLPERILSNHELAGAFPEWTAGKIERKLGIVERRIVAPGETASDLAFQAAEKLFADGIVARDDIDFLIFCSQSPDYILPTTACVLQARLGLPPSIGAFDMNLGCSGFVYGLSIAAGLIVSGAARNVLLLTADTYSRLMNAGDKSVRTLFGDGAAATLISGENADAGSLGPFIFGTDGRGANQLIVQAGGARLPRCADTAMPVLDGAGNTRSQDDIHMNGAGIMSFTLREVPIAYRALLDKSGLSEDAFDHVIVHQANKFMLDALQKKLAIPDKRFPRFYRHVGNTVSSTIPFALEHLLDSGKLIRGQKLMLLGFGVGLSWAGVSMTW